MVIQSKESRGTWRVLASHPTLDSVNRGNFDQFEADIFGTSLHLLGYTDITVYNSASARKEKEYS